MPHRSYCTGANTNQGLYFIAEVLIFDIRLLGRLSRPVSQGSRSAIREILTTGFLIPALRLDIEPLPQREASLPDNQQMGSHSQEQGFRVAPF